MCNSPVMERSLLNRVQATLLALATAALFVLAVFNLLEERQFQQPDDGVWWREAAGGLEAQRVLPDMAGQRAGIQIGDRLTGVSDSPTARVTAVSRIDDLERALYRTGPYGQVYYVITRDGIPLDTPVKVIPEPLDRSLNQGLRSSASSTCSSASTFSSAAGELRAPPTSISSAWSPSRGMRSSTPAISTRWTGPSSGPMSSPSRCSRPSSCTSRSASLRSGSRTSAAAGCCRWSTRPARACSAYGCWPSTTGRPPGLLKHRLDQTGTAYDAAFYVLVALLFLRSYGRADSPVLRQQLKWLTRGTLLAVLPFTLFYAIPFLFDLNPPRLLTNLAGLSLIFLPLTFSWAIVRYRLMDTDLIFKRGVAYTLASALILGGYFGIVALIALVVHQRLPEAVREWALASPFRRCRYLRSPQTPHSGLGRPRLRPPSLRLPQGAGRIRPRPRSETDLQALLRSIVEQLPSTLLVARVAIFLAQESGRLRLAASHGLPAEISAAQDDWPWASLISTGPRTTRTSSSKTRRLPSIFPKTRSAPRPSSISTTISLAASPNPRRRTARDGAAISRTIAVIGLGRTLGGDFLSSEDVELLESLASYIGIALQNASLYARLEEKIAEFERLKEFNENIVESINVGIFAIDLDDRIESWNAQMEAMYALSRAEAIGQELRSVFPPEFIEAIEGFRSEQGVHHLYKFRLTTRAGELRTANIAIAPLLSRDFVPVGRIILVDDITERVALETQLAQADKLSSIGLLAAGVAHEINTPLAVISSYAQMLAKQLRGDARLGPVLDKITQQSFRAAEIANGLLNFSRTSTTEFRSTDLNQVIRDTLSLVEHQFKTAQILVDLDLADELPPIHGNPGKLQQVFLNLLLNAKDAMPGGGRLRVATLVNGHVEAAHLRLRLRHRSRAPQAHLRSLLHHQDHARRQAAAPASASPSVRHHSGTRRQNPCRKRRRRRHDLSSRVSAVKEFRSCLK